MRGARVRSLIKSISLGVIAIAVWLALSITLGLVPGLPGAWPAAYASAVNRGDVEARSILVLELVAKGDHWFETAMVPGVAGILIGLVARRFALDIRDMTIATLMLGTVLFGSSSLPVFGWAAPTIGSANFLFCLAGSLSVFRPRAADERTSIPP